MIGCRVRSAVTQAALRSKTPRRPSQRVVTIRVKAASQRERAFAFT